MTTNDRKDGRERRTLYVAIDRTVQVAARHRALAEGKTLSQVVEEALRMHLGFVEGGADVGL